MEQRRLQELGVQTPAGTFLAPVGLWQDQALILEIMRRCGVPPEACELVPPKKWDQTLLWMLDSAEVIYARP